MRIGGAVPLLLAIVLFVGAVLLLSRGVQDADSEGSTASKRHALEGGERPAAPRSFKRYETLPSGVVYNSKIGNATLHTMAARYPDEPSEEQRADALQFIHLLSMLYPCGDCASEFQKLLANNPPELESKDTFIQWLCRVHNIVNERLLKPVFDCSVVKERWICGCVTEV